MPDIKWSKTELRFLEAFRLSLKNETVFWKYGLKESEWSALMKEAQKNLVLPMIYETVYPLERFPLETMASFKQSAIEQVLTQIQRENTFRSVYSLILHEGCKPIVLKGIICRHTYPLPDHRQSWDEDIWIQKEEFEICDKVLVSNGFKRISPMEDHEIVYKEQKSQLIIEVHTSLFPQESKAYGSLNGYFKDVEIKKIQIEDTEYYTLNDTDHLFYLICHMYKHFLHFGAGIRQLTDILMYAKAYKVDWERLWKQCKEIHADLFVAALFSIGRKYLDMETTFPEEWMKQAREEEALLKDILDAGMQAQTSSVRIHSATMTLNAVEKGKRGKKSSVWKSLFPSVESLKSRYKYVDKRMYLLPIAWAHRIVYYLVNQKSKKSLKKTIQIGKNRIELLKRIGIIEVK